MRRIAAGLAWVGLASYSGSAVGEDGPPLLAPAVTAPVADPAADALPAPEARPAPTATPAPAPTQGPRQVLAIPGVTRPRSTVRGSKPVATPAPAEDAGGSPPLLGPAEMSPARTSRTVARPAARNDDPFAPGGRSDDRPPLTLESIPAGSEPDTLDLPGTITAPGPRSRSENPSGRNPGAGATGARTIPTPIPPRRPPGFLGRFLPPVGPIDRRGRSDEFVKVEPRTDPAADAALKRRVERQINETFGTRLRSYEVRVVGREVVIRARAARFWQRRAIKGGLEALPALSGYRAVIEMVD